MLKNIKTLLVVSLLALSATACFESKTENKLEDVGESIEETTENTADKIEDGAEEAADKVEDAMD